MSDDPYADLQRLGPERVRWLVETGHLRGQDEETRKRQASADKKWKEAGRRLRRHRSRKG